MELYKEYDSFGEYMKRCRKLAGYTMKEITELTGISQPFVSMLENDKNKPSSETLVSIVGVLPEPTYQLIEANEYFRVKDIDSNAKTVFKITQDEYGNIDFESEIDSQAQLVGILEIIKDRILRH